MTFIGTEWTKVSIPDHKLTQKNYGTMMYYTAQGKACSVKRKSKSALLPTGQEPGRARPLPGSAPPSISDSFFFRFPGLTDMFHK